MIVKIPCGPSEQSIEDFPQQVIAIFVLDLLFVPGNDCVDSEVVKDTMCHSNERQESQWAEGEEETCDSKMLSRRATRSPLHKISLWLRQLRLSSVKELGQGRKRRQNLWYSSSPLGISIRNWLLRGPRWMTRDTVDKIDCEGHGNGARYEAFHPQPYRAEIRRGRERQEGTHKSRSNRFGSDFHSNFVWPSCRLKA